MNVKVLFPHIFLLCVLLTPGPALADLPDTKGPVLEYGMSMEQHTCAPGHEYSIEYPRFGIKAIDAVIQNEMREWSGFFREECLNSAACESWSEEILTSEVYAPSTRYLSVVFQHWRQTGGMGHGWPQFSSMTFDRQTGKEVRLADIFLNRNKAAEALPDMISAGYAALGCDPDEIGMADGHWVTFAEKPQEPQDAFHLEPDGLALHFDFFDTFKWECSPVLLPREKLLDIGADPKFWDERNVTRKD